MWKRAATCVAASMSFVLLAAAQTPPPVVLRPGALAHWNVVVITLDATSAERIGTYDRQHQTMPFLEELARKGVVYEHAYTTVGETGPAHATILSGTTPAVHGVSHNGESIEEGTPWLPALLHDHGYITAASTVAFFIDKSHGFTRGFDHFISIPNDARGNPGSMTTNAAAAEQALPLLDVLESRGDKPFFCWIHLKGGHGPLTPIAPRYLQPFDRSLPSAQLPTALAHAMPGFDNEESALSDTQAVTHAAYAYYDANLMEADDALQRLVDGFRERALAQNTLFIITADHGDSFDHGLLEEHSSSPWESTLHIPLIFYADSPRLAPARIHDRLAITTDIAPTIVDLLKVPPASDFAGASLLRARRADFDAASAGALTYDELVRKIIAGKSDPIPYLRDEVADLERTGNFYWVTLSTHDGHLLKLIHYGRRSSARNRSSFMKMFDVTEDPAENVDLLQSGAKMRTAAAAMLAGARKRDPLFGLTLSEVAAGVLSNDPTAFTRGMSKEAIETLRSLGYLH